jgi:hypothetical protein
MSRQNGKETSTYELGEKDRDMYGLDGCRYGV